MRFTLALAGSVVLAGVMAPWGATRVERGRCDAMARRPSRRVGLRA